MNKRLSVAVSIRYFAIGLFALLPACEQDPQLPAYSQISLFPQLRQISINEVVDENNSCQFDPQLYQDSPLHITVNSESGMPISGVEVSVYVDYAGNTYPGFESLSLFSDVNGNGVIDIPDELVSGSDDKIFRVTTGSYTGSAMLMLRVNISCAFKGSVFAFSGPINSAMRVEVSSESVER